MPFGEPGRAPMALAPGSLRVEGHERHDLTAGWRVAACAADACATPAEAEALEWLPATVPGTAAGSLRDAGRWRLGQEREFDREDWWFQTEFEAPAALAGELVLLRLDGVATVHEVFLNGEPVAVGESMFAAAAIDVGDRLREGGNQLAIRCLALDGQLGRRRKPRARWRTRLADNRLRFFRTMLLGRCPGFAPGPAAVGPWRPVWLERRRGLSVSGWELRSRCEGGDGFLTLRARARTLDGTRVEAAEITVGGASGAAATLSVAAGEDGGFELAGEVRVEAARRWWPHTHGEPALHPVSLRISTGSGEVAIDAGRVGFRELAAGPGPDHDVDEDGLDLRLNGVGVFARGAVWTPLDIVGLAPGEEALRVALEQVREAGMNMLRVPGTYACESPLFYDLCDELGIMVWQDFPFANFDYPLADDDFRAAVETEAAALLAALAGRPCLAVLCGNSEVEQQAAMLGLDPALGRGELFGELLPAAIEEAAVEVPYVPSAPCGGVLPFRPGGGIANYYGVGGYMRPLADARLAGVRFAAECLAIANVPDPAGVEAIAPEAPLEVVASHPRWKAGVPRDAGSGWDFDDVRDHYLELLFGLDPAELRRVDHDRYLELSRAVSGEVMAAVFGEWRRGGSSCAGGLVLWLRDLVPGAGWGLVDHAGNPKVAWHHLRRALRPRAVWITDEGLGGLGVHVANDAPEALAATLRIGLYRGELEVGRAERELRLAPHAGASLDLEELLGRFVDASWAYRFGPPAQDLVLASLERRSEGGGEEKELLSQAAFHPAGLPAATEPIERLGLEAEASALPDGAVSLRLRSARAVYGLRVAADGFAATDDAFVLAPAETRAIALRPTGNGGGQGPIQITAAGCTGRHTVSLTD